MSDGSVNILLIEDNPGDARLIKEFLSEARTLPFALEWCESLNAGLQKLNEKGADMVLTDLNLPDSQGPDTYHKLHAQFPDLPIVVLSALDDESVAINAVSSGAQDYLVKGQIDGKLLARSVRYAFERKRSEKAMDMLRYQNELILNSVGEGIFGLDLDGNITFINPVASSMLGYKVEELIGKNAHSIFHQFKPDRSKYPEQTCPICLSYKDGAIRREENEVYWRKDGSSFPIAYISTPIMEGTKIQGAVVSFNDITKRKLTEGKLLETTQRFELATASAQLGIWDWDVESDIMVWNDRMFELYGISRASFPKCVKAWQNGLHPDDYAKAIADNQAALNGDKEFDTEFRVLHPDGKVKVLKANAIVIRDEEGKAVRMLGLNRDITEQKDLEEELRKATEELDTIFHAIPATVWYKNTKNCFIRVNKAAADLLGMTVDEINGKTAYDLFPANEADQFYRDDLEVIKSGVPKLDIIESVPLPTGDLKWVNTDKIPQKDENGNITGIIVISSDISELKKSYKALEDEIDQRKKVEEQLRNLYLNLQAMREEERTGIAREIHDELGQIMTAIKMDVAWMNKKYSADETIFEKTLSMLRLIDVTIKSIRKICTELRPGILDHLGLGAAINWQAQEFQNRTGILCKVSIEEDIEVDGDQSTALFRIFQEALTNVMRHADATEVTVSLEDGGDKIKLEVRDNGKGISETAMLKPNSFGLLGMRERVYPWKGIVNILSSLNNGTIIEVILPGKT